MHLTLHTDPAASAPPFQAVRAVKAVTADVPFEISSIGNVEASSMVEVKARVTAPVVRVNFAEGDEARQGQVLFELDGEPLPCQLAEIEANIARDDANYRNLAAIAAFKPPCASDTPSLTPCSPRSFSPLKNCVQSSSLPVGRCSLKLGAPLVPFRPHLGGHFRLHHEIGDHLRTRLALQQLVGELDSVYPVFGHPRPVPFVKVGNTSTGAGSNWPLSTLNLP
jgi:hypothetical protein